MARIAFSTEDDCEYLIDYLTRASERFLTVKNALASNYNIRAKQTRDSYISSCNTPLGEYTSYSISALTSSSTDIDFERVACGDKPYAFILITDERNPTTNIFSMMFLNKMISDFVDYADNSHSKSLTRDVVCLYDEFANMPEFPALSNKITTLRSRRIWLNMMIQSLSQLKMVDGEETSEIVQDNCDFQVCHQFYMYHIYSIVQG